MSSSSKFYVKVPMIYRRALLSVFRRGGCANLHGQSVVVPGDYSVWQTGPTPVRGECCIGCKLLSNFTYWLYPLCAALCVDRVDCASIVSTGKC